MQTILGANGVIATELAKALPQYTNQTRLVSRQPKRVNEQDELFSADLTDSAQVDAAVAGSEIAYLTVGLPYKLPVWQEKWPLVMRNVLNACEKHGTKLVFFDNVYLYGKVDGWMTEASPINPCSEKGKVRAQVATMLMDAMEKGKVEAQIARSADFYGLTPMSFLTSMVFEKYAAGKSAQWMVDDTRQHSFTYTPDAGKAMALLGNASEAYGQAWHLPTAQPALTGAEFLERAAAAFGVEYKYQVIPKWMLRMLGVFIGIIKENREMLYQNEADYLFDSSKFERHFAMKPTSYEAGIAAIVEQMKRQQPA